MNKYGELIEKLILVKDLNGLTGWEADAINEACNILEKEGNQNGRNAETDERHSLCGSELI